MVVSRRETSYDVGEISVVCCFNLHFVVSFHMFPIYDLVSFQPEKNTKGPGSYVYVQPQTDRIEISLWFLYGSINFRIWIPCGKSPVIFQTANHPTKWSIVCW